MPVFNQSKGGQNVYFDNKSPNLYYQGITGSQYCKDSTWSWGDSTYGQLSNQNNISDKNPLAIAASYHTLLLRSGASISAWGRNDFGQCNIPTGLSGNVIAIAAGDTFSVALKKDGTVVAWGDNSNNQCNVPSTLTNVINIAAGSSHVVALKDDGTIVVWGGNYYGQGSIPLNLGKLIANIGAGGDNTFVIKNDGTIVVWGDNTNGNNNVPYGLSGIVQASIKKSHVIALRNNGSIVTWGSDNYNLNNVPTGESFRKVSAGYNFSGALTYTGEIVLWGDNTSNQTTIGGFNIKYFSDIACGISHSICSYCSIAPTPTPTLTITPTPISPTPTKSPTPTPTLTPTITPSTEPPLPPFIPPSQTPSNQILKSPTPTPTITPTRAPRPTPYRNPVTPPKFDNVLPPLPVQDPANLVPPSQTPTPSITRTPTLTPTLTRTPTRTAPTPTVTTTVTRTALTPTPTVTVTSSVGSYISCSYPAFNGFATAANKYSTLTLYKWDSCISTGNYNDGVDESSLGGPVWKVDGHVTILATSKTYGVIRESTGKYFSTKFPVGSIQLITNVIKLTDFPNIVSDTRSNSNTYNPACNNPDGSMIFIVLSNDYYKNCSRFAVDGPVYGIYYDIIDNLIYASGSFTSVNGLSRNQIARFNIAGTYDPTFNISLDSSGNPFDNIPNDIRRVNDSILFSALGKYGTASKNTLTLTSQDNLYGHIIKTDLLGVADSKFTPFVFLSNNSFIDYVTIPSTDNIVVINNNSVAFRSLSLGNQSSSSITAINGIQGVVTPNETDPSTLYILQQTNNGISPSNIPHAVKAIDISSKTLNSTINNLMGQGLISTDNGGYGFGAMSPDGDYMVLNRVYSDANMTAGYWNTSSSLDSQVITKINTSDYTQPLSLLTWNTVKNAVNGSAKNGKIYIDNLGRIYYLALSNLAYTFGTNTYTRYSLVRFTSQGVLDTKFNVMSRIEPNTNIYNFYHISDYAILICGSFTSYDGDNSKQYIIKVDDFGNTIV
jgi:hypothetical protein